MIYLYTHVSWAMNYIHAAGNNDVRCLFARHWKVIFVLKRDTYYYTITQQDLSHTSFKSSSSQPVPELFSKFFVLILSQFHQVSPSRQWKALR